MNKKVLLILIILALPLFLFVPKIGQFAFPAEAEYSDLLISHLPNAITLRNSLTDWHVLPWWSNSILGGAPFAANPLAGMWYLPEWLVVAFPAAWSVNTLIILHLLFGGIGFFLLMRHHGLGIWPAVVGALCFELMPKLWGHYASGHISLVYAVCWTPWLLLAEMRRGRGRGVERILPGVLLGIIFIADVRWVAYAGILWFCTCVWSYVSEMGWRQSFRIIPTVATQVLVAGMVAAPLLLPFVPFLELSTRQQMTLADSLTLSLPWLRLLNLFIPDFRGYAETLIYPGAVAIILLVWAGFHAKRSGWVHYWLSVFAVSLILALGSNFPLVQYFYRLPMMDLLRVPSRFVIVSGLALAVIASEGVERLIRVEPDWLSGKAVRLVLVFLAALLLLLSSAVWVVSREFPLEFFWGGAAITMMTILILLRANQKVSARMWSLGVIGLIVLDLGVVSGSQVTYKPQVQVQNENAVVFSFLVKQPGSFRIYSPSYSLPQQNAAATKLRLADGVDPMQLENYSKYMQAASGVPAQGYSVTLPPFAHGQPSTDNQGYVPDLIKLGMLNVGFIASDFPIQFKEKIPVERLGKVFLYTNPYIFPQAWVQPNLEETKVQSSALVKKFSPNQIKVSATGPGILVLSEAAYPAWHVWVDGYKQDMLVVNGLFRGVMLKEGDHKIRFQYVPIWEGIGLGLAGLIWIRIGWLSLRKKAKA